LAGVALDRCAMAHPGRPSREEACGACWERAIRDDERVVAEFELPREQHADSAYVDVVAVERACAGDATVQLSPAELSAAIESLWAGGHRRAEIERRLRCDEATVRRVVEPMNSSAGSSTPCGGEAA
jgi:hypothetical protein